MRPETAKMLADLPQVNWWEYFTTGQASWMEYTVISLGILYAVAWCVVKIRGALAKSAGNGEIKEIKHV